MAVARFDMGLTGDFDRKALKKYVQDIDENAQKIDDQTVDSPTDGTVRPPDPTDAAHLTKSMEEIFGRIADKFSGEDFDAEDLKRLMIEDEQAQVNSDGADNWVRIESKEHGRSYYFNTLTKESSWSDPLSNWVRIESQQHDGRSYWFNPLTRESSWSDPKVSDGQQLAQHMPPDTTKHRANDSDEAPFENPVAGNVEARAAIAGAVAVAVASAQQQQQAEQTSRPEVEIAAATAAAKKARPLPERKRKGKHRANDSDEAPFENPLAVDVEARAAAAGAVAVAVASAQQQQQQQHHVSRQREASFAWEHPKSTMSQTPAMQMQHTQQHTHQMHQMHQIQHSSMLPAALPSQAEVHMYEGGDGGVAGERHSSHRERRDRMVQQAPVVEDHDFEDHDLWWSDEEDEGVLI